MPPEPSRGVHRLGAGTDASTYSIFPCGTELAGPDAAHHSRLSSFLSARCVGTVPRPHPANRRPRCGPQSSPSSHSRRVFGLLGGPPGLSEIRSSPSPIGLSDLSIHHKERRLGAFHLWVHDPGHAREECHSVKRHHVGFHLMLGLRLSDLGFSDAVRRAPPPFSPCPSELGCFSAPGHPSVEFLRRQESHLPCTSFAGHDGRIPPGILHVQGSFASLPGASILPQDSFSTMNTAVLITT